MAPKVAARRRATQGGGDGRRRCRATRSKRDAEGVGEKNSAQKSSSKRRRRHRATSAGAAGAAAAPRRMSACSACTGANCAAGACAGTSRLARAARRGTSAAAKPALAGKSFERIPMSQRAPGGAVKSAARRGSSSKARAPGYGGLAPGLLIPNRKRGVGGTQYRLCVQLKDDGATLVRGGAARDRRGALQSPRPGFPSGGDGPGGG